MAIAGSTSAPLESMPRRQHVRDARAARARAHTPRETWGQASTLCFPLDHPSTRTAFLPTTNTMSYTRLLCAALACLLPMAAASGQAPNALRTAMLARDSAVAQANVATWDRLTAPTFTVVMSDGSMLTKSERIAEMRTQRAGVVPSRSVEVAHRYGDVYVMRAFVNGERFLEVWVREHGQWKVAAVQVTAVKK